LSTVYSANEIQDFINDPGNSVSGKISYSETLLSSLTSFPPLAAASAMITFILIYHIYRYVRANYDPQNVAGMALNIASSVVVFSCVIGGFAVLTFWKGTLFLLFTIFSYPFVLAITRNRMADNTIISMYLTGWNLIGEMMRYRSP
jgi:hypothetical protein